MRRKIMSVCLAVCMLFSITCMAFAVEVPEGIEVATNSTEDASDSGDPARRGGTEGADEGDTTDTKTKKQETVNGSAKISVSLNGKVISLPHAVITEDYITYMPLKDFSEYLGCTVSWNKSTKKLTVQKNDGSLTFYVTVGEKLIQAKGRYFYMNSTCRMYDNVVYVPARALAKVFGLCVWYDDFYPRILFSKGKPFLSADQYYNAEDLKWLSKLISAESRAEPFEGQIAVGNVVLNRVNSSQFPNTIKDVIFANIQFSVVKDGQIYYEPTESSVIAAKVALEGTNLAPGCLFFVDKRYCKSQWVVNNRPFYTRIGNHWFYK